MCTTGPIYYGPPSYTVDLVVRCPVFPPSPRGNVLSPLPFCYELNAKVAPLFYFPLYYILLYEYNVPGTTVVPNLVVSCGSVGGPRAYQDQFHRVHARRGFFLHQKLIISGKRESVC